MWAGVMLSLFVCLHAEVTPLRPSTSVASGIGNGNGPRRRPVSTYQIEPRSPHSSPVPPPYPTPSEKKGPAVAPKSPFHPTQPNAYPAPSQPAPPPPPRTVSKNAEPVPRYQVLSCRTLFVYTLVRMHTMDTLCVFLLSAGALEIHLAFEYCSGNFWWGYSVHIEGFESTPIPHQINTEGIMPLSLK